MAANRERRSNAGNKMSKLLEEEEEDEFYTTTYGGFAEVRNNYRYSDIDVYCTYVDDLVDISNVSFSQCSLYRFYS